MRDLSLEQCEDIRKGGMSTTECLEYQAGLWLLFCVYQRDTTRAQEQKKQKESSARHYKSLDESFPCFATKRKVDLAAFWRDKMAGE